MNYVGFDWASRAHDVTVLDEAGGVVDRWAFPHSETGWVTTLGRLARHGAAAELPVIVERTGGLIIDRLLAAGHPWCRCIPPPSSLPDRGGVLPERSLIPVTATSWLTICAPTVTGSGG